MSQNGFIIPPIFEVKINQKKSMKPPASYYKFDTIRQLNKHINDQQKKLGNSRDLDLGSKSQTVASPLLDQFLTNLEPSGVVRWHQPVTMHD